MSFCPEPIRQSDEEYCSKCLLRWDAGEEKPRCLHLPKSFLFEDEKR